MTDDFDREMHDRLARVAAAVPVEPAGSMGAVSGPTVVPGPATRRLAFGGLVPILALVLIGTAIASVAKVGPFAPGASDANRPVAATTTEGQFELTIRSAKARYAPSEPILIDAVLVYRGDGDVVISHAQGASVPGRGNIDGPDTGGTGGPLGFGIVEPVIGDLVLSQAWAESCERTTLASGGPLTVPFAKSGSFSGDDPRADEYRAYLMEPSLRLEAGTWHVYAVAEYSIGDCGADPIQMRVDIQIDVLALLPSSAPSATETEAPMAAAQTATDRDGEFELMLRSGNLRYAPNEVIDVTGSLTYRGQEQSIEISHDSGGPIMFGIRERVFGEIDLGGISRLTCGRSTLQRDEALVESFKKAGFFPDEHPDVETFRAFFADPELRLPVGTWHIYARASGPCMESGPAFGVQADITIVVSDDPSAPPVAPSVPPTGTEIELRTASEPSSGCHMALGGGRLALDPRSGLGVVLSNEEPIEVMWPFGFTARQKPAGAVLIGTRGEVVAREGDRLEFSGAPLGESGFFACTGIRVVDR